MGMARQIILFPIWVGFTGALVAGTAVSLGIAILVIRGAAGGTWRGLL
jgi:hypothetical protein